MKKIHMKKNSYPGVLITFCGLDGCGKTTMIKRLASELRQTYDVYLTKQPTESVRESDMFRTYMDNPDHSAYDYRSLSLYAASDRLQHVEKVIIPELAKGNIVISDRYYYSCLANLRARGYVHDKWIYDISEYIIKPDIAFFLDTSAKTAIERVRSRIEERDRYIDIDLQHRLQSEYVDICKASNGILISTETSPEETYKKIIYEVRKVIE